MRSPTLLFIILFILTVITNVTKFFVISYEWSILFLILTIISYYINVHNKNKDVNTPKPVYLVNQ